MSRELLRLSVEICIAYGTDGHRADIGIVKTAKTIAAYEGRKRVKKEDISRAAQYVLPHRMHKNPLDNGQMNPELKRQGYTFVTVSDLFAKCNVTPRKRVIYSNVLTD